MISDLSAATTDISSPVRDEGQFVPWREEDLDVAVRSVQTDPLPILDQVRGVFYPDDGRQA